jgi:hypothetical protein
MERYREDFPGKLKGIDFSTLEESRHSVYGLSTDLDFVYFNPGWTLFAMENGAAEDFFTRFRIGTPLVEALSGARIREFYIQHYRNVLATGTVWHHAYECSSATEFRNYHQSVYRLDEGNGLIVVNSLTVKVPMKQLDRMAYDAIERKYVESTGLITQCSNCRTTRRAGQSEIWDWVPDWVENIKDNVSHSICPICFDYYWK